MEKKKKGWIAWVIVGGLLLIAMLTCPKKQDHIQALAEKLAAQTDLSGGTNKLDALFTVAFNKLSEYTLEASVTTDDYLFFSIGKLFHKGIPRLPFPLASSAMYSLFPCLNCKS